MGRLSLSIIHHNRPTITEFDGKAIEKVLKSNRLVSGSEIENFENDFCDYIGLPHGHAVAVSSGTAALYISLNILGLQNKRIAIPAYSCVALRNAVSMSNSHSVYLDNSFNSPNLDVNELNNLEVDACIAPHMFGIPIDITGIKTKIIIEDCCQTLGASFNNKKVGNFGQLSIFSFYATKLITSGGHGGMIVSRNINYIKKVRDYLDFDMKIDSLNRFNFQITEIQAAIGRVQLNMLESFLERRKQIFEMYLNENLTLETINTPLATQVHYRAVLKTNNQKKILADLNNNNICAIIPVTKKELLYDRNNCIDYCETTVSLPIYPTLKDSEVLKIINTLKK